MRLLDLLDQSQSLDQIDRALHAMGKIAPKIDPDAEMDLPDKPPGMHWSRYNCLAERFEHWQPAGPLLRR